MKEANSYLRIFHFRFSVALIIFVFFFSLYFFTMKGFIIGIDAETMYLTTQSIVRDHDFSIEQELIRALNASPGIDGKLYAWYGMGQSVVALPLYILGNSLVKIIPGFNPIFVTRFFVSSLNLLVTAFICVIVLLFCQQMKYSLKTSILVTLIYGLGTMAWSYSKTFFSHPLTALSLLLAIYALFLCKDKKRLKWIFLAGLSIGFGMTTRIIVVITLPLLFLYLIYISIGTSRKETFKKVIENLSVFILPIVFFILLISWYNIIRFGAFYRTGYPTTLADFSFPLHLGLYGNLFSPGRGLFIYVPVAILFLCSIPEFLRTKKVEALLFFSLIAIYLIFHSILKYWEEGWCWGPRFLVPILPFLIIPMGTLFEGNWLSKVRLKKILIIGIIICSVFIQVLSVLVDPDVFTEKIIKEKGDMNYLIFNPRFSPLKGQIETLRQVKFSKITSISSLNKVNIHDEGFKSDFQKTIDFWFIYFHRLGLPNAFSVLATIPFLLALCSGYLLLKILRRGPL